MNTYTVVVQDDLTKHIYKIPAGSTACKLADYSGMHGVHVCPNTYYASIMVPIFNSSRSSRRSTNKKFSIYKPVYFERFKYLGKGFKLILKKKRGFFNCIFGYSHIYWIKLQSTMVKKTKKYKFMFVLNNHHKFQTMINILKKVKPINRYTLRGLRTYTHVWLKRKGRKSVATHV